MHIKLLDLINNKKLCNIDSSNKKLCVVPTLFVDDKCNCCNNGNIKKHKYTFIKNDTECIDDNIYEKLFDNIKPHTDKRKFDVDSKSDKKTSKRAKKSIKERISRKKREKKPKIKIH